VQLVSASGSVVASRSLDDGSLHAENAAVTSAAVTTSGAAVK
jgi:hypothetical protein